MPEVREAFCREVTAGGSFYLLYVPPKVMPRTLLKMPLFSRKPGLVLVSYSYLLPVLLY